MLSTQGKETRKGDEEKRQEEEEEEERRGEEEEGILFICGRSSDWSKCVAGPLIGPDIRQVL